MRAIRVFAWVCILVILVSMISVSFAEENDSCSLSLTDPAVLVQSWEPDQNKLSSFTAMKYSVMDTNTKSSLDEALSSLQSISGESWQSAIIKGTADVLADRARKEIELWFLSDMLDKTCEMKLDIVDAKGEKISAKKYFKQLCEMRDTFDVSLLPSRDMMISAIREDIETIPARYVCDAYNQSALGFIMTNAVRQARNGSAPEKIIAYFGEMNFITNLMSLHEPATDATDLANVKAFLDNHKDYKYLYVTGVATQATLLAQKMRADSDTDAAVAKKALGYFQTKIEADAIVEGEFIKELKENATKARNRFINIIVLLKNIDSERRNLEAELSKQTQDTTAILKSAATMLKDSVALLENMAVTLNNDAEKRYQSELGKIKILASTAAGQYREALMSIASDFSCTSGSTKKACHYLPVLVSLAEVQNAEDASAAINALASPVGAWRLKKASQLTWSVGAFVGASYGYEKLLGANVAGHGMTGSVFAPLGVDWDWNHNAGGVFFSMFNFGNLVNERLTNTQSDGSQVSESPTMKFSDIFSPGMYYRHRLWNSPFVAGVGASYIPNYREITDASGATSKYAAWHYDAFISVDVTLFPLF